MNSKWSDDRFLDEIRAHVDVVADDCVAAISTDSDYADIFRKDTTNFTKLPADAPQALQDFFVQTDRRLLLEKDLDKYPYGFDFDRVKRGERVFLDHAFFSAVVLLAKSLPEGYAAPCLSVLLNLSGNLRTNPYRRLMGVLQLVLDVSSTNGFEREGRALAAARQARLMHAGIRRFAPRLLPDYIATYRGQPVNLEDMLGTIMGLSLLVIDGMPRLGDALPEQDAEDYYYLWRAFAVAMGIHPPGKHGSDEWVPETLNDARAFYASYERRHYVHDAARNPDGVALARENLAMLQHLLPRPLRLPGVRRIPELLMTQLIGDEGCRRVGLTPYRVPFGLHWLAVGTLRAMIGLGRWLDRIDPEGKWHPTISEVLLQGMIRQQYGRQVTFEIPQSIKQVREMVQRRNAAAPTGG
ncbi:MAG: oxygenase MpaB family protein [Gemmatimonas sp.]